MSAPIVVIGAGAAGLMAALHAAGGERPVLVLETTSDGGRKILISGGGRCNVLPSRFDPRQYITESSPNILRNVLRSFPDHAQRRFFEEELRLPLVVEAETGKLFPASDRARDVRDRLVAEVRARGGEFRFEARVTNLLPPGQDGLWDVRVADAPALRAHAVILATGGLSVPATGSDGAGLRIVQALGHTVHETYPALTPITLDPPRFAPLAGIALTVTLRTPLVRGVFETRGGFLFTHRGYSGPAVLDISHHAVRARAVRRVQPLHVQWTDLDEAGWTTLLGGGGGTLAPLLRRHLPVRLADALLVEAGLTGDQRIARLTREQRRRLVETLVHFPLPHNGDEGYRKAEVTGGGVALEEIDARTLQSRVQPRLFLCGELLDAFGPIGGYNFAWAWATGRLAGLAARAA